MSLRYKSSKPGFTVRVLGAFAVASEWSKALGLLKGMQGAAVRINTAVCNAAINACERAGMWQVALVLLEDLDARRLAPDEFTGGSTVAAMAAAGKRQEPRQLLSQLVERGVQNQVIAYSGMVNAHAKREDS
ncbi:unnamed protein product [Symbiodinium pilosum]|uniref:Pentatricopeptide repeat-containing protein n=1 Tax=Symbiodinium pilosum TaxID=2952 RepID=A0A812ITH6_SYMPI|nr:unnamed protein product [Symbiodinium pilosum]